MALRVLIAGCGRLGNLLAAELIGQGCEVWGIRRQVESLAPGIHPIGWDIGGEPAPELPLVDWLVYAASPVERTPEAYQQTYVDGPAAVLDALPEPPAGLMFVSSTAVYGQDNGELVDESDETQPQRFNGRILLQAEQAVQGTARQVVITRCSGLYGPEPGRLVRKIAAGQMDSTPETAVYGNRIHRQDAARAMVWILQQDCPEPLYLLTDPNPARRQAVYRWLADYLDAPALQAPDGLDPGGNTARGKRLRPARLLAGGFEFIYPDYQAGYRAILSSSSSET